MLAGLVDEARKIVGRTGEADENGFAALVRDATPRLFRLAFRVLGNRAEAEDAVQEAYVRAYDALASGGYAEQTRMEAWLYTIVGRVSVDMLRKRKVRAYLGEGDDPTHAGWAGVTVEQLTASLELESWLAALPAEQRAAVVLKYVEGMTSKEVGEALGVSEGAVEQRLVRARAKLKGRSDEEP